MTLKKTTILWGAAGLLAGFGAGLGLRACAQQPAATGATAAASAGADEGRYRVVIGASAPADVYLVDSATGATWERVKDPKTQQDTFNAVRVSPAMPPAPMMMPGRR